MKSARISDTGNRTVNQKIKNKKNKNKFFQFAFNAKSVANYNLTLPGDVCFWRHRLRYCVGPHGDFITKPIYFPGAWSCGHILHGAGATKIEWSGEKCNRAKSSFIHIVRKSSLLCYHRIPYMRCIL